MRPCSSFRIMQMTGTNTMRVLKRLSGWFFFVPAIAFCLSTTGADAAVPIVVGGELLGATGVNVEGSVYDVEIAEGTCIDLYDGCDDVSDFTFTTLADAALAGQALFDQVYRDGAAGDFDTVPNLNAGCTGYFCGTAFPYGLPNATNVSIVSAVNHVDEIDDVVISGDGTLRTFDSSSGTFHTLTTYATWTPVPPAMLVVDGGELQGATGVDVGGTLYDVEFVEGTCVDLFDGCDDVSDFAFATVEDALLAAQALQDQVVLNIGTDNFDTVPNLTAGCSGVFCGTAFPFGQPGATEVDVVSSVNQVDEVSDFFGAGSTERTFDSSSGAFHTLTTYAVWTVASSPQEVPMIAWPAVISMLALGFRRLRAA